MIVASDFNQQLAQGFASGNPPDVFYLGNDSVATYAKTGSLAPLDKLKNVKTLLPEPPRGVHLQGPPVCGAEGLLDARPRDQHRFVEGCGADEPRTTRRRGRSSRPSRRSSRARARSASCTGPEFHRLGVFMIQNGGWLVSKDGKTATVNSQANIQAFNFVKQMINAGSIKLTNQLGVGWGGEGFGKQQVRR